MIVKTKTETRMRIWSQDHGAGEMKKIKEAYPDWTYGGKESYQGYMVTTWFRKPEAPAVPVEEATTITLTEHEMLLVLYDAIRFGAIHTEGYQEWSRAKVQELATKGSQK